MDGQSEERRGASATPGTGSKHKQSKDSDTETSADNQVDRRTNKASDRSRGRRRGRFLGRIQKRRATDSAEQANVSTEQAATKPKIGLVGVVITALIGFFFGIASNQVTDFVKRADDCYDALSQYGLSMISNWNKLFATTHDPHSSSAQVYAATEKWNTLIQPPQFKVMNTCPEINKRDFAGWKASADQVFECYTDPSCSPNKADTYRDSVFSSSTKLLYEAQEVSEWGLVRRAKYEVTHLY
jgi:hypothetical protein